MKIEKTVIMVNILLFILIGCGSQRHIVSTPAVLARPGEVYVVKHDTIPRQTKRVYTPEELKLQAQMKQVIQDAEPTFKDIAEIKASTKKMSQAIDDMAKIALIGIERSRELRKQNDSISRVNSNLIHNVLVGQSVQNKEAQTYYSKAKQLDYYKDQAVAQNNALKYFTWAGGICFFITWMLNLIAQRRLLRSIDKKLTII